MMYDPNSPWVRRTIFLLIILLDIICFMIPGFIAIVTRKFNGLANQRGPLPSTGWKAVNTGLECVVVGALIIAGIVYFEWYISNDDV